MNGATQRVIVGAGDGFERTFLCCRDRGCGLDFVLQLRLLLSNFGNIGVTRGTLFQLFKHRSSFVALTCLLRQPRCLFEDLNSFGWLLDGVEGACQHFHRQQILGVGLEGDLEFAQGGHAIVGIAPLKMDDAGHAGVLGFLAQIEQAVEDLERVVGPAQLHHDFCRSPESFDGLVDVAQTGARVRHPQVRDRVRRVKFHHLFEDVEGVAFTSVLAQPGGHLIVGGQGVAGKAEVDVDLGQPGNDVPVAILKVAGVPTNDAADLLENRDGFDRKTLPVVVFANLLVGCDGLFELLEL